MSDPGGYFDEDVTAESRKSDHIELAFKSQQKKEQIDQRFYYEPMLSGHLQDASILEISILGHQLKLPMWVSSMTGGTGKAGKINKTLAKACGAYGMGMGLGSCRGLLFSDEYLPDFQVKEMMGDYPLYANLGVAQLEQIAETSSWGHVLEMMKKLQADGLIIHVNPLQEWVQPEGDRFKKPPLETIMRTIDHIPSSIIVKEVGQGIGPASLEALLQLPITAIEFAASGGTNFAMIELLRTDAMKQAHLEPVTHVGHTANEMVHMLNTLKEELGDAALVQDVIISGGVKDFLDSYYLRKQCQFNSISGHASGFLKYALQGYDELCAYIELQREGLLMAESFLRIK